MNVSARPPATGIGEMSISADHSLPEIHECGRSRLGLFMCHGCMAFHCMMGMGAMHPFSHRGAPWGY